MTFDIDDFLFACRCGDIEDVQQMIEMYNGKDENGNTGLHFASANGHLDIVELLLEKGSNPNALNITKNSPLHWAALNGHLTIVESLLNKGANCELKNDTGRSASTLAEQQGHHDCVNKLLSKMKESSDDEQELEDSENVTNQEHQKKEIDLESDIMDNGSKEE